MANFVKITCTPDRLAVDLQRELVGLSPRDRDGAEWTRFVAYDAQGSQIATGSALYVPCSGRGGVEDGGDSAWADAPDLDSLIERYLDGDGAEAEGDEDEV